MVCLGLLADHIVLLRRNKKELERALNGINQTLVEAVKSKINKNEAKVLICRKNSKINIIVKISDENTRDKTYFLQSKMMWDRRVHKYLNQVLLKLKCDLVIKEKYNAHH